MKWPILILILSCLFFFGNSVSAGDAHSRLHAWVEGVAVHAGLEVRWIVAHEVLDQTSRAVESYEVEETARYQYPRAMLVQTRVVPQNEPGDARRAMRLEVDQEIDANGHWRELHVRSGSERDLGENHSLRDLVGSQAVRAPALLGMWIAEHPGRYQVEEGNTGSLLVSVPDLNLRFELKMGAGTGPEGAWVSQIEMVDGDASRRVWWTYDDPVPVENGRFSLGSVRVQHSVLRDGSLYEGFPSLLEYARVNHETSRADGAVRDYPRGIAGDTPESDQRRSSRAASVGSVRWGVVATVSIAAVGVVIVICTFIRS